MANTPKVAAMAILLACLLIRPDSHPVVLCKDQVYLWVSIQ